MYRKDGGGGRGGYGNYYNPSSSHYDETDYTWMEDSSQKKSQAAETVDELSPIRDGGKHEASNEGSAHR